MTTMSSIELDRDLLVERLFESTVSTLELFGVYLGEQLGLYRVLAEVGDLSAPELAERAGIHERYAREWLEQQAVAGFLTVTVDAAQRRYSLPAAHRDVLADPDASSYLAPFSLLVAGVAQALPEVLTAFRTGGGVPWTSYGSDARNGQAAINRPAFMGEMSSWIGAIPDVHGRLSADPPARVADIACGAGWSSIGLARAFPKIEVHGFDLDEDSIIEARANVAGSGVEGRVRFSVADATKVPPGRYDLVCIFEALHDMSRPVEVLAAARSMLEVGGTVLVVDERVAEEFSAPGDPVERMMYGWSITCCLPTAMCDEGSAATGTVMRTDTLRRYADEAGFASVEVLAIENDFLRFYRLRP